MTESFKPKHPGGRPTKYTPEVCALCIELMREGAAVVEVAYELNVHIDTIYEWRKVHPEFSEALKQGVKFSEGWWTREGRLNIKSKEFNTALWFINMKNRFGWSDKKEADISPQQAVNKLKELVDGFNKTNTSDV